MERFLPKDEVEDFGADVVRIQNVLRDNGLDASLKECTTLWEAFSESKCAGWLGLPGKDESVYYFIQPFINPDLGA